MFVIIADKETRVLVSPGRAILEQGGAQTATGARARAQTTAAGTFVATTATADATDKRRADMRTHGGQSIEKAVEHRRTQSQEDGA